MLPRAVRPFRFRTIPALVLAGSVLLSPAARAQPEEGASPLAAIDAEIARTEAALAELQRHEASTAAAAEAEQSALRDALERAATLQLRLPELRTSSEGIDRFYDNIVAQLIEARRQLHTALDEVGSPSAVPAFEVELDLEALATSAMSDRLQTLDEGADRVAATVQRLRQVERDRRRTRVKERWELVWLLNDVRIQALSRLSENRREQLLGISREGVEQLQREVNHLVLGARTYVLIRRGQLRELPRILRDPFLIGALAWAGFKVLLILLAVGVLRGREERIEEGLRSLLHSWSTRSGWRHRADQFVAGARVVGPWLVALAAVAAIRWALGPASAWQETRLAVRLAVVWILYRLAVDALVAAIVTVVRRYRFEFGAVRTVKLLRSVRTVLRVLFAVAVLLTLSEPALGRGYLFHVVFRFSLVALAIAGLIVFLRWKKDVVAAYLELGPRGALRARVESSGERWYGGFVAAAALVVLAGQALAQLTRDFVLGFDQTRRALAFLFRRRIEQQAELTGYAAPEDRERLPTSLLAVLDASADCQQTVCVDYFPGLEQAQQAIRSWTEGLGGGSLLLTGDLGIGRTSWLNQLDCGDLPRHFVSFDRRLDSDRLVATALADVLEQGQVDDTQSLRDRLLEQPPRVVLIDRGQNLILGKVGGYEGFESFISLVDGTASQVFWVVAFSELAWEHIVAVHPQLAGFREQIHLEAWPEERIRELIRRRVEASGVQVDYTELSFDAVDEVPYRVRADETETAYTRLLWDTSMGLPRVALEYWKRSLVPIDDGHVKVRLFRPPAVGQLERLGDTALFLLAAIMTHESLTTAEMAVVTRYSERMCAVQLSRLDGLGVILRGGDRHWVKPFWQPAVRRLLKRRNLLSD